LCITQVFLTSVMLGVGIGTSNYRCTRGIGKALAREFLLSGVRVVIASCRELEENLREGVLSLGGKSQAKLWQAKVVGITCDIGNPDDVQKLSNFVVGEHGVIDIWVTTPAQTRGFRPLLEFTNEDIEQIVSTNLAGSLLCTREATRVMKLQGKAGHIFNIDGAGSRGSSTPFINIEFILWNYGDADYDINKSQPYSTKCGFLNTCEFSCFFGFTLFTRTVCLFLCVETSVIINCKTIWATYSTTFLNLSHCEITPLRPLLTFSLLILLAIVPREFLLLR
ncbi:hypothetical protein MKW94_026335, partial [Papaver nudicaule]|nr:hypothetical protein [Papaver nudicaule]